MRYLRNEFYYMTMRMSMMAMGMTRMTVQMI